LDHPFQSQSHLLGINNETANILRGDAKSLAGAYADAHDIYKRSGQTDIALRSAWLAENWRELVSPDDRVFGKIKKVSDSFIEITGGPRSTLNASLSALNEAGQAREVMRNFLNSANTATLE
jgi:hypothetical protein